MKYIFVSLINIVIVSTSFSQYSINYMSSTAGAIVGDGVTSNVNYFGPNDYGSLGTCGAGSWSWTHALCATVGNEDDLVISTKNNDDSGSTWSAGGGASRYMAIDLGQSRHFNELRVFQMHNSDGKVTSIQMYSHPNLISLPTYSDPNWVSIFPETNITAGTYSGGLNGTVSDPTIISFPYTDSRFVLIEAKNDGTHGNSSWTEIRELRLFNINVTLPIELLNFNTINIEDKKIKLEWQTASEINNNFFTIERSKNGLDWKNLKKINGAGNSSSLLYYNTTDFTPYQGISYYRLKQTDFDGQFSYSHIVSVNIKSIANNQIEIYPNPTSNKMILVGNLHELEVINVYNILGEEVTNQIILIENNKQKTIIDLSKLSTGTYYIKTKTTANKVYKQ